MALSKLTPKFQATIPRNIRSLLDLKAGDTIVFEITKDKQIIIKKAKPLDHAYLKMVEATLDEWSSVYDEEDYTVDTVERS
jgi:antitoxin PrlF